MNPAEMLQMMRDPLGAPLYPPIVQALLVVTYVLHIFFVTLAFGTSFTSIYGFLRGGEYLKRLARLAARITPNAAGFGVLMGIAPLLFVQTIYDPAWYAANTLEGFWSVAFIFVVMGGYALAYLFYLKGSENGKLLWSAGLSLALLFLAGFVMHVLSSVSLYPARWGEWYAPAGVVDTRGVVFHSYNLPRLVFLLFLQSGLSLAVVLLLFSWYFRRREDAEPAFLDWVAGLGRRLALWVSPLYAFFGLLWAVTQGSELGLALPMAVVLGGLGVGLFLFFRGLKDPAAAAPKALLVWMLALLVAGVVRETIRAVAMGHYGYSVANYPYIVDWGSIVVFLATTVLTLPVIVYLVLALYQSGATREGREPAPWVERLGRVAVGMLGAWFGFFLLLGLWATFRLLG
ncbi:MAG: hypothetical protein M1157_06480 [Deinococcus sp.]|nr:hypothetical protein [Deinococcus sp.]